MFQWVLELDAEPDIAPAVIQQSSFPTTRRAHESVVPSPDEKKGMVIDRFKIALD